MKVLVFDTAEKSYLGFLWKAGAFLLSVFFDKVIPAKTWEEALESVFEFATEQNTLLDEVQVWGHGLPGQPLIAGKAMPTDDYRISISKRWWFRSCGVFSGLIGHEFASSFSLRGIEVAGHTTVMGRWALHPNLYALRSKQYPSWSQKRHKDYNKPSLLSPRTILALQVTLPDWAFEEDKQDDNSSA